MKEVTATERAAQIRAKLASGIRVYSAEEMMNTGTRRTPEKREMLRRLKERAEERGQKPWPAKF